MLTDILRRYQRYNPATGAFDQERSLRNYAQVIGVNVSTLSLLFSGIQSEPSRATLQSLVRTFPAAADDIAEALRNQPLAATA